ncbi:hypothetical protein EIN_419250 [Entamoeba invadens IP1]|uniref:Rho-GAP domain-containing protein n=1 Tax=Entamoeba invadens IP1 TaxID=370355 RepID=A0A0A1U1V2_ENTIV|nr:hypothetical protein EIN_419250 [Entamoeba invadens IP1]ELP87996.1 hypothetical protein EIN_419250 [Entamoeba invadens IP1]|eukprot:XP_004254767.1 hypothetical protein EIN_419250 [Entamoeba invadens IP1]
MEQQPMSVKAIVHSVESLYSKTPSRFDESALPTKTKIDDAFLIKVVDGRLLFVHTKRNLFTKIKEVLFDLDITKTKVQPSLSASKKDFGKILIITETTEHRKTTLTVFFDTSSLLNEFSTFFNKQATLHQNQKLFGISLQKLFEQNDNSFPPFLEYFLTQITSHPTEIFEDVEVDDIPSSIAQVEQNKTLNFPPEMCWTLLTIFLKKLPVPLLYPLDKFVTEKETPKHTIESMQNVVTSLPYAQRAVLEKVFLMLDTLLSTYPGKMLEKKIFSSVCWDKSGAVSFLLEEVVVFLIGNASEIFVDETVLLLGSDVMLPIQRGRFSLLSDVNRKGGNLFPVKLEAD